jgi:hypothetical protein
MRFAAASVLLLASTGLATVAGQGAAYVAPDAPTPVSADKRERGEPYVVETARKAHEGPPVGPFWAFGARQLHMKL